MKVMFCYKWLTFKLQLKNTKEVINSIIKRLLKITAFD